MPVIGFLGITFAGEQPRRFAAFRNGLSETGYVEGHNASIEYRWAEGQYNRLPERAPDLIRHHVNVVVTLLSTTAALAAKATTTTIPIVFSIGDDPVKMVQSRARRGPAAMRLASIFSALISRQRGWDFCASWCQRPLALAYS